MPNWPALTRPVLTASTSRATSRRTTLHASTKTASVVKRGRKIHPVWLCRTMGNDTTKQTMTQRKLPDGLHLDTLAVRTAIDRSQYGENSEALYLTSSFVQPDAATAARRFAMEEEGYTYTRV